MSLPAPDLLRLSVLGAGRRRDVAVPADVPVAALLAALLAEVGAGADVEETRDLGPGAGHDLSTATGRRLGPEVGLRQQGVCDGDLLVLVAREAERPPHRHDDLVDAVREVVARERTALSGTAGRAAGILAALTLVVLTAVALVALDGDALDATAGASGLVAAAALLLAARPAAGPAAWHPTVPLLCGVAAAVLAAAGAWLLTPAAHACLAGAAALATVSAVALGLLVGLPGARAVLAPLVVTGAVLVTTGVASLVGPGSAGRVLPASVVLAVVVAGAAPTWALPAVGRGAEPLLLDDPVGAGPVWSPPPGTAAGEVVGPVRTAHELVVAAVATLGLLLVVTAPVAVADGPVTVALVLAAAGVTALRSRRHRGGVLVLTGLAAGAGGLVATTVATLVLAPTARPVVAAVLVLATTVLACAVPVLPRLARHPAATVSATSVRSRRLAAAAETVALVSLLPLLAVSSGLLDVARGV